MRIMHISNNYTPYAGGVVSSLNAILPALQQKGHDIVLITLNFASQMDTNDPSWVYRIPSLLTGTYRSNPIAFPLSPLKIINQKIVDFKPDIIHVHHPFLLGVLGKSLAQKYAIPCFFTYHTMYEQYAHYVPAPEWIAKPLIKQIVLSFCKDIQSIITPSRGIKQYLYEHNVTTPLHVIPSPLQHHFFDGEVAKKSEDHFFNLLYVGRFREEKNVVFLIDLFAQLDSLHYSLTLVGYGDQEGVLKKRAYNYYGFSEKQITFVIKPELQHLRQLYSNADLFLFPSQTDTQGLVLAEAMAHSTPIIALPGHGQEDIIQQGGNGFIVRDVTEMKNCIEWLRNNEQIMDSLSVNAYKTAQDFKSDVIIEQLMRLYRKCL